MYRRTTWRTRYYCITISVGSRRLVKKLEIDDGLAALRTVRSSITEMSLHNFVAPTY